MHRVGDAPVPGAFRRPEEVLNLALTGAAPDPRIVEAIPDRVLWGTDFPHPNSTHDADEADLVDLVPQIAPDPGVQKKLLVDNPAKLYGF